MTLASMLQPSLCPLTPMHLTVDDAGDTKETLGTPNAQVCLHSDADAFLAILCPARDFALMDIDQLYGAALAAQKSGQERWKPNGSTARS